MKGPAPSVLRHNHSSSRELVGPRGAPGPDLGLGGLMTMWDIGWRSHRHGTSDRQNIGMALDTNPHGPHVIFCFSCMCNRMQSHVDDIDGMGCLIFRTHFRCIVRLPNRLSAFAKKINKTFHIP